MDSLRSGVLYVHTRVGATSVTVLDYARTACRLLLFSEYYKIAVRMSPRLVEDLLHV